MSSSEYSPAFLAEDRRQRAIVGMVVVTMLSFILGWDDLIILVAQLASWIVLGLSLVVIHYGSGQHLAALMSGLGALLPMYKWLVGAQLVYMFNMWLCRISGIAFYARLN
ncbi:hypothetical protein E8E15_006065 [Penicillium rubens]|nr:hypothetical protein E8E15_006065 [Penicillium rubens]